MRGVLAILVVAGILALASFFYGVGVNMPESTVNMLAGGSLVLAALVILCLPVSLIMILLLRRASSNGSTPTQAAGPPVVVIQGGQPFNPYPQLPAAPYLPVGNAGFQSREMDFKVIGEAQ